MSYSNSYAIVASTVLLRKGIKHIIFMKDKFLISYYGKCGCKSFPNNVEIDLDDLVKKLNELPVDCESETKIPSEDNC